MGCGASRGGALAVEPSGLAKPEPAVDVDGGAAKNAAGVAARSSSERVEKVAAIGPDAGQGLTVVAAESPVGSLETSPGPTRGNSSPWAQPEVVKPAAGSQVVEAAAALSATSSCGSDVVQLSESVNSGSELDDDEIDGAIEGVELDENQKIVVHWLRNLGMLEYWPQFFEHSLCDMVGAAFVSRPPLSALGFTHPCGP